MPFSSNNWDQKELIHEIRSPVETNQNRETNSSTSGQPNFHCTSVALTVEVFFISIRHSWVVWFLYYCTVHVRKHSVYLFPHTSTYWLAHSRAQYHSTHIRAYQYRNAKSMCVIRIQQRARERREHWKKYGYVNQCCFLCRWRKEFVAKEFSEKEKKKKEDFFCQTNNSSKITISKRLKFILVSKNFCISLIKWRKCRKQSPDVNWSHSKIGNCGECVSI